MNIKTINLDINKPYYGKVMAKQGDTNSRFLLFHLLDGPSQFNLTGRVVRAYAIKQDGAIVFNDLIINDAAKGFCTLELTSQLLALPGIVKIELYITENTKKLTSIPFELEVIACINNDASVVSTNEFTALLQGLASLQEYNAYKAEITAARGTNANLKARLDKNDTQLVEWAKFKTSGGIIDKILVGTTPTNASSDRVVSKNQGLIIGRVDSVNSDNYINGIQFLKNETNKGFMPVTPEETVGFASFPFKDIFLNGINKGNNGFTKLPNGMILQWGRVAQVSVSEPSVQFTFPLAFPVTLLGIVGTGIAVNPNDNFWMRGATDYKTYCIFRKNNTAQIIDEFHWIAIGY